MDRIVNPAATGSLPQFSLDVKFIDDWSSILSTLLQLPLHINHSDFPQQGPSGVRRDGLSRGDPEVGVDKAAHLLLPPALHPQVDDSDVVVDDEDADLLRTAFSFPPPAGSLSPWPGPPCSSPPPPPASGPSTTSRSPTSSARKSTGHLIIYHSSLGTQLGRQLSH